MVPPAPGRLSMTMLCPRIDVRRCPIRRAITSAGPAGAKPTTILIGRLGNVCADAMPLAAQATATMAQRNVGLASMPLFPTSSWEDASAPISKIMGSLTLRDGGHSASKTRVNALEATSSARGERTASRLLVHHAVAQRTDAGNLDLEHVTGLHPQWWIAAMADAFRRAGGDHVARQERREVRAERDDLRHRIDQEIGG